MSVRVIAGTARGRRLAVPAEKGVRPTGDRARETLFNVLGERVAGARFLDVFAGSGAVGIEALSRAAERAVFVEPGRGAAATIADNIARCGFEARAEIVRARWRPGLQRLGAGGGAFDVAFFDPPYDWRDTHHCLAALAAEGLLVASGVAVVEHRKDAPPAAVEGWRLQRRLEVGRTSFSLFGIITKL